MFLYGSANAGKTSLLKFLSKAMCGETIDRLSGSEFREGDPVRNARSNTIRKPRLMQVNQVGLPVFYDEVGKGQLTDTPLRKLLTTPYTTTLDLEYDGYPAVVCTSNITPPTPPEFQKRALFFEVSASLTNTQAIENGNVPNRLTDQVGPSCFAEYIRRIIPMLTPYIDEQRMSELDVYAISSAVLLDILNEAGRHPTWARKLSIDDYFGEAVMSQRAAKALRRFYAARTNSFERRKRENLLIVRYDPGNRSAEAELRHIGNMLPPKFNAEVTTGMFTCALSEIERLCKMRFTGKHSRLRQLLS